MNESLTYKTEKRIYDFLPHEPEMMATVLFIIGMSIYYLWRMFAITPQYEELYTYYNYISRGPIQAALTWPSPNNHVGYSVLSSIVDMFTDSFIGLRGISYVCAVSNLILVNRICRRYYSHWIPFGAMLLYASMQIVNEYSVQGRGYTMATSCFLMSVYIAGYICSVEEAGPIYYIWLGFSFALGMYTVPSSTYWVVPVFTAISLYLLINAIRSKDLYIKATNNAYVRKFIKFFKSTVIAAFIDLLLYGMIWLHEGSRILIEDETSAYAGLDRGTVLVRAPVTTLLTGIRYMRNTPYVRSVSPERFDQQYFGWSFSLYDYMLPGLGVFLLVIVLFSLILAIMECVRHFAYSRTVINLLMVCNILIPSLMLYVSKKLPYLKTFSYGAFVTTLSFATVVETLVNGGIRIYNRHKQTPAAGDAKAVHREIETVYRDDRWFSGIGIYLPILISIIFFVYRALSADFNMQLGERENDLFNTLYIADVEKRQNPAVLDCDQQYLLKFGWDIDCEKTDVQGADCVIIDKDMLEPGRTGDNKWKFYRDYDTIDWDYIETMHPIYENENFILYVK